MFFIDSSKVADPSGYTPCTYPCTMLLKCFKNNPQVSSQKIISSKSLIRS